MLAALHWAIGAVGQQVSLSQLVSSVTHTLSQTRANTQLQLYPIISAPVTVTTAPSLVTGVTGTSCHFFSELSVGTGWIVFRQKKKTQD